jgi:acetyl-CoA C-acetyltransferase
LPGEPKRAAKAREGGFFAGSVVPVKDFLDQTILDHDEFIKPRTTMEGLASLKPAFEQLGAMGFDQVAIDPLPAGGAHPPCAPRRQFVGHRGRRGRHPDRLRGRGQDHGFKPRARIVAAALSGADPTIMLTGPMPAARKALAKAGMTIDQIDLFEVNEAFAAVPMRFMKEMGVPHDKVNVNGGAIAMGHPLGATGAMILNTLIDELHRRKLRYGTGHAVRGRRHGHCHDCGAHLMKPSSTSWTTASPPSPLTSRARRSTPCASTGRARPSTP